MSGRAPRGSFPSTLDDGWRPPLTAALDNAGPTGALVRALDWGSSPLGPPASWPPELEGAVAAALASASPMALCDRVLNALAQDRSDDVALLAVRLDG